MSFTSLTFYIFLAITLALYWLAGRKDFQNLILLAASYIFYGWVNPLYALLLGSASLADYGLVQAMRHYPARKRLFFTVALVLNVGGLLLFKYLDFFMSSFTSALNSLGLRVDPFILGLVVPVGISFYTLKKVSYILDCYRGTVKPERDFVRYAIYVAFFPQIFAGPIEPHRRFLPQLAQARQWSVKFFEAAWPLLMMGLFKKIVIADNINLIVDKIYLLDEPSGFLLLVGTLAFTVQILTDFSAYTDLSRGAAYLFGLETSENFRNPYLALTPTQFWDRWHITLSDWLRDYIFFPARRFLMRRYRNASKYVALLVPPLVTMLVSGLWHGAGWNFIVWGGLHGLMIVAYQLLGLGSNWKPDSKLKTFFAWGIMFSLLAFSWAFFRASSLAWLFKVLLKAPWIASQEDVVAGLAGLSFTAFYATPLIIKLLLDRYFPKVEWLQGFYLAGLTLLVLVYANSGSPDFIYSQF
jgi:alginate O-acetyltransferase complex protein AlgI